MNAHDDMADVPMKYKVKFSKALQTDKIPKKMKLRDSNTGKFVKETEPVLKKRVKRKSKKRGRPRKNQK